MPLPDTRPRNQYLERGWVSFPADAAMQRWAAHARPFAAAAAKDPAQSHWLRCGGTWFVGVDALPNDGKGQIGNGPPLAGAAMDFVLSALCLNLPFHRAQVSVCYPGYPKPSPEESEAAHDFRRRRDAAHVDGLLAEGPGKRRRLKEPHAYILGICLTEQSPDAAPLAVWDGSHRIMGSMFRKMFAGYPPESWDGIDVTAAYQEARRSVFATCLRRELPGGPGDAVLLHRHLLHGVAPWGAGAKASPEGRMVAYFRPEFTMPGDWLDHA
ncbi:hypothetical protein [Aestuariivirga sp.]|uniref:hypothetical protein n=1 Tax=Aestuariivirga sp. TaxID=2650926 RepID=UPI00391B326E